MEIVLIIEGVVLLLIFVGAWETRNHPKGKPDV